MKGFLVESLKTQLGNRYIASKCATVLQHPTIVLMYHDLREDVDYGSWLKVSRYAFTQQLEELTRFCDFIGPNELMDESLIASKRLRILLTFDDGFVNSYRIALPILEQYGVPALFFISTENMETGAPFWFDLVITPIQYLKLESLDLRHVGLQKYVFPNEDGPQRWSMIQALLTDIKRLGNSSGDRVKGVLGFFEKSYASSIEHNIDKIRPLTREEIKTMKKSGLCHFGSHSHRHDILTFLGENEISDNLLTSKRLLEEVTGEPVVHISYPNGDTNPAIETMSRDCGYECGFGTQSGMFFSITNRMAIPRIAVGGYDSVGTFSWNINRALLRESLREVML